MSNKQKAKGTRFENVVRNMFIEYFDIDQAMINRTSPGDVSDLIITTRFVDNTISVVSIQCKKRKDGFRQFYRWLEKSSMLVVGADNKTPLLIMRLDDFSELSKEFTEMRARNESEVT